MTEKYIACVDMGTSKIALTVAKVSGEDVQILYLGERASRGIRRSAVFNPKQAEDLIHELISEAENELKIKILQVVVGLPRCDVRVQTATAKVPRSNPDESITSEEIETLKDMAQNSYPLEDPSKEVLYGAVAQSFSADEEFQYSENDIVGVISDTFEGNFKLFIGKKISVRNIEKIFSDLGIGIARKYFTPGPMAKAVLRDDEIENGVALLDLGGGSSSVSIYQGRILRYYAAIPFGGKVITSDIKNECAISEALAENIKMAYGACMPERLQNMSEKILQINGDEFTPKQLPVKYLSEILTLREKEIVLALLYEIQKSGVADELRRGVVITGGAALMGNLASYIKDLSGYNVRLGYPIRRYTCSGCPGADSLSIAASIGMIYKAKSDCCPDCIVAPEEVESIPRHSERSEESEPQEIATSPSAPRNDESNEGAATRQSEPATRHSEPAPRHSERSEESITEPPVRHSEHSDAPEGTDKDLFGNDIKPKKDPQKPKEPKPKIKWFTKVNSVFRNLYDGMGEE